MLRYVLKHLRQRRLLTPFSAILSRSGLQLEHSTIAALYEHLVLKGDWTSAEETVRQASSSGLLDAYRFSCQPQARWTELNGTDADGDVPRRRGGHAMCMDEQNGLVYLFGGWDGQQNLDDFWVYDVQKDTWRMLSMATSRENNGPGPRACHKMVFDPKTGAVYVLGRLSEGDAPEPSAARGDEGSGTSVPAPPTNPRPSINTAAAVDTSRQGNVTPLPWTAYFSEFYRFHTRGLDAGKWDLLFLDTSVSVGDSATCPMAHGMNRDLEGRRSYLTTRWSWIPRPKSSTYRVDASSMETGKCPSIRAFTPTISALARGRCYSKQKIVARGTGADTLYAGRLTSMDRTQQ